MKYCFSSSEHVISIMLLSLKFLLLFTFFKDFFFFFFFLLLTIFKVFIEFVTILILFYVLVFLPQDMWDLSSLTRD